MIKEELLFKSVCLNRFSRFAPSIPVVLYHGSKAEREDIRHEHMSQRTLISIGDEKNLLVRNIFVTSYEIAMNDRVFLSRVEWRWERQLYSQVL